jgi:Polyketide cyclase / dehydrase and lipid transport
MIAIFGTTFLKTYGWGVFVCLPFCIGWLSVFIDSIHEKKSFGRCLAVSSASVVLLGILLLLLAIEGVICLAMAFPIGLALGVLGGVVGYTVQSARPTESKQGMALLLILLFSPILMAFETMTPPQSPLTAVKTRIEISASPDDVWNHVVSFSRLSEPTELIFRSGLAYPIEAKIEGRGVGAIRRCIFSTGEFVEPIRVWDSPRLLAFDVVDMPVPMREMTPYRHVHPAHLDGYFASEKGQFLLTPTPNGTTILEGTTWYRNKMWPTTYWNVWSNLIVHKIHHRVLSHIKKEAEGGSHERKI